MPIESDVLSFALNNGVGVLFGVLMWFQANNTIKENTKVTGELKNAIILLTEKLNGKNNN